MKRGSSDPRFFLGISRTCTTHPSCFDFRMRIPAVACIGSLLIPAFVVAQPDRINGRAFATRSPVIAQHGMVCTSHPLATQIGIDVLKAGGTAVDAAIAANAALGLME